MYKKSDYEIYEKRKEEFVSFIKDPFSIRYNDFKRELNLPYSCLLADSQFDNGNADKILDYIVD